MIVLALDTSTDRTSVAIVGDGGLIAGATLAVPRRHGAFLAPAVAAALAEAGLAPADVSGVAVGLGPGRYTGLRVGIAFAQTFAAARGLATVGRSGLDVLAAGVRYAERPVIAVIDARRRELFRARFAVAGGVVAPVGAASVGDLDALLADVADAGPGVLVVGEGALAHRAALEAAGAEVAGPDLAWPDAERLGVLALAALAEGRGVPPGSLQPIYLRGVDARIGWEERGRLQGGSAKEPAR